MERVCTLVVLVILIPCFTIQGQEQQEALCPSGWFKERSSCYKLSKKVLNWQAAKKACEDLNSTLAIISSEAEHQALKPHIRRKKKLTWIGLQRNPRDKKRWLWVDGSPLNYTHWGDREPNSITEECVEIRPFGSHNGGWNDQECSDRINYICEKDVNECASNPCKNGATCANTIEGFNCLCTKGFEGKICNEVAIKPSQVSPRSSKSLATQDTPVRILTSSNDIYFPATSSLFHEGTVSSSVQPSAFPSSSVQMEVVITPRQVSPYSFTPLTAAQSPQVRTLLSPALHNYEVTVSSSAHQSTFPSSSVQMKVAIKPSQVSPCSSKSLATQDTPVRILTSSNDIYFPDTSSLFHEGTVSSSVQPSAFPSSSVQMEVVITPRQVSPYSFTPLTAAQSSQVRTLLPPALHNYEVTVSSSAHQSTFPSSSVQMKVHKCSPQLSHGVSWETTDRGSTDKKPCPNGAEGKAKRKCSYDGTWENANFLNCRSAEYSKLISKMNAIASGSSNLTVPQVLAQLKNATKPIINSPERPSQIYGGDLIAAVEILAQITEYSKHRNVSSKEDFQNIAHVASNLLEPVNSRTWMALDKAHKNKSLILLTTLDSYGMEVSLSCEMSGKPNSVEAKNLLMMIEDRNCSVSRSRANGSYISYSNTTIYLPSTVFSSPNSRAVTVIYLTLNDILALSKENADEDDKRSLADTTIVSTVVRPKPPAVLRDPVKIVLKNRKVNTTSRNRCVFWRPDEPAIWGTSGCTLVPSESNASFTTCECNHLTIFAALVDPYGRPEKGSHKEALEIISIVGCSISLVAVILTIILLSCFSRPIEAGVKVLINLCAAIAITCVLVIFEGLARRKAVCPVVAGLLHYFALALFSWMLCEGILHYLKVVKPLKYGFAVDDYVKYFYMCGWGFPAIIVSISLAVTQAKGYGSKATCWLDVKSGLIWTFIGPTLVVILINCVVLYLVMRKIMKPVKGKVEEKTQITKLKAGVRVSMAILPLVGITWVFGILSFSSYTIAFKYIFAIFNSLQGLMIFIFHCAFNGKIKQAIRKRMMYRFKRGKLNHSLKVKEKGGNLLTNFTRKRSKCNEHECEVLPIRRDNVELNTLKDREDESLKTEDESLRRSLLSNSNE